MIVNVLKMSARDQFRGVGVAVRRNRTVEVKILGKIACLFKL